jgi:hypothetical protein
MPAKSKAQQRFMGLVHSVQKGETEPSEVSQEVRKTAKDMTKKSVKKYASTEHKDIQEKSESLISGQTPLVSESLEKFLSPETRDIMESIDFQRGADPKRSMGIGKAYEIWRKKYNNEPFIKVTFFLKDPMGNKKRYVVNLMYERNYDERPNDSVWWSSGRLISAWQGRGGLFAPRNMQNKPHNFFEGDPNERMLWNAPEIFNKEVIDPVLDERPKVVIDKIIEEWWEDDFETLLEGWFKTGVMTLFNTKYETL